MARHPQRDPHGRALGDLACRTCHLLADAEDILRQPIISASQVPTLQNLIAAGTKLHAELLHWRTQAETTPPFQYTTVSAPSCTATPLDLPSAPPLPQSPIHIYSTLSMAGLWNQYRVMIMILLECLQRCSSRQRESSAWEPVPLSSIAIIDHAPTESAELVSEICASISFMLGEVGPEGELQKMTERRAVGGFILCWPLRLVVFKQLGTGEQRRWIVRRLMYIRNVLGIHEATNQMAGVV